MSANIEHFMKSVSQAVTKQKTKPYVQPKQVQKVVSGNVISITTKTTASAKTTTRMTDEEYRKYIIAAAIEHIIKQRGTM